MGQPTFNKLNYLRIMRAGRLTHAQFRVLVTLLTYANPDGTNAHPGYAKLARQCQMSKGTVSKSIQYLKQAGWIRQTAFGRPRADGGEASTFSLTVPQYLSMVSQR